LRLTNRIFIVLVPFLISCDLVDPVFDNILDVEYNDPPALLFSPNNYSSSTGKEVDVDLYALKVVDVAGMRARILYDDSKLEVLGVSSGEFFSGTESPLFVYDDDGSGRLDIYSVIMGTEKKVSGSGKIAIIKFFVKRSGEALLNLSDESQLLDTNGNEIEIRSLGQGVISAQ